MQKKKLSDSQIGANASREILNIFAKGKMNRIMAIAILEITKSMIMDEAKPLTRKVGKVARRKS